MAQSEAGIHRMRVALLSRAVLLALALNILVWIAAAWQPDNNGSWRLVSLGGCVMLGVLIGQWWALIVILAFGVIHAIPVYLGLLPGYLSTWGEALWWIFALSLMLTLTAIGVLARRVFHRIRRM